MEPRAHISTQRFRRAGDSLQRAPAQREEAHMVDHAEPRVGPAVPLEVDGLQSGSHHLESRALQRSWIRDQRVPDPVVDGVLELVDDWGVGEKLGGSLDGVQRGFVPAFGDKKCEMQTSDCIKSNKRTSKNEKKIM
ncbi:tRNA 2-thiocytidine biosynthesis protein TtcA [Striga asiatica]|uniref:tRNA 2-thiocytidine biosynthesis protein TtcA n=1 Tax=Striga asiatica TaxID=4170 RepID=A0A5A7PFF6_STRAF|nr:tRNA 2-thiocytidine biosynthesis protein TtcA [Striga asiatica]